MLDMVDKQMRWLHEALSALDMLPYRWNSLTSEELQKLHSACVAANTMVGPVVAECEETPNWDLLP